MLCFGYASRRHASGLSPQKFAPQLCSLFVFEAAAVAAFSITQQSPGPTLAQPRPIEAHLSRLTKKSLTILISVCKFHAI